MRREKAIRLIINLIFLLYFLLIFEGALRKWILPELSDIIFFIRDPFLLLIYFLVFYYRLMPRNALFSAFLLLSFAFLILFCINTFIFDQNFLVSAYGLKNYLFCLPLAFIIQKLFKFEDLVRIAKFTCYVAIPIAILTYIQYKSPTDSFINKNVGESGGGRVFTVVKDVVRPYGTFSFVTGQSLFIPSILVMLLTNYFLPKEKRFLSTFASVICFIAFLSNMAVSGSRGTFGSIALIILFLIFSSLVLINKKRGGQILGFVFFGMVVSTLLLTTLYTEQLENLSKRQELAQKSEGDITERIANTLFNFTSVFRGNVPFNGFGLGVSSIGGSVIATGRMAFMYAEGEWGRILFEAGLFWGFAYIGYRLILAWTIFKESLEAIKISRNPTPMIFVGYLLFTLVLGQATGNTTINGYTWMFLGFTLSAIKIYSDRSFLEGETEIEEA